MEKIRTVINQYIIDMLKDNMIYIDSFEYTSFQELGVDSILFLSIVIGLECKFNIIISDDFLSIDALDTLDKIERVITQHINEKKNCTIY